MLRRIHTMSWIWIAASLELACSGASEESSPSTRRDVGEFKSAPSVMDDGALAADPLVPPAEACTDVIQVSDDPVTLDLTLSNWNDLGQEPLSEVLELHQQTYPQVSFTTGFDLTDEEVRQLLEDKMMKMELPLSDVLFEELGNSNIKGQDWVSLDELSQETCWGDSISSSVLDLGRRDGRLFRLPLTLHRQNNAYYDLHVLRETGLEPPTSVADVAAFGAALRQLGYEHPFCVGNKWAWTMDFYLFEAVLPALAGADYHRAFWRGDASPDDPVVRQALEFVLDIWPFFNPDANDLTYSEGMDKMLLSGTDACVMTIMGDWAIGHFAEVGLALNEDYIERPYPGTEDLFVVSGEAAAIPEGVAHLDHSQALLATLGTAAAQTILARASDGIPARMDVNVEDFTASQIDRMRALQTSSAVVGSYREIAPAGSFPDVGEAIKDMLAEGDVEIALDYLRQAYSQL